MNWTYSQTGQLRMGVDKTGERQYQYVLEMKPPALSDWFTVLRSDSFTSLQAARVEGLAALEQAHENGISGSIETTENIKVNFEPQTQDAARIASDLFTFAVLAHLSKFSGEIQDAYRAKAADSATTLTKVIGEMLGLAGVTDEQMQDAEKRLQANQNAQGGG